MLALWGLGGRFPAPSRAGGAGADPVARQTGDILQIKDAKAYPNPFKPRVQDVTISYELTQAASVEIAAYDWSGEFVATIRPQPGDPGVNTTTWGGQAEDGRALANGIYFVRIEAGTDARRESAVVKIALWND
jgi:flagellar hook assembly protein FlgD